MHESLILNRHAQRVDCARLVACGALRSRPPGLQLPPIRHHMGSL